MESSKKRVHAMKGKSAVPRKRIMLVEDHPLVIQGIISLVQRSPDLEIVAEAGTAQGALLALEKAVPDLLLLDLSLPDTNGIELLKDLHIRYPGLRVLVLSMHEESVYAERALRAGARGYIMKQESGSKVLEAIHCVLSGELYVSPALAARMLKLFVSNKSGHDTLTDTEELSDRELQVYTQIGHGVTTRMIAEQLHLSVKTIQTYREHIKRKLRLKNTTALVHHAMHWAQSESGLPERATERQT